MLMLHAQLLTLSHHNFFPVDPVPLERGWGGGKKEVVRLVKVGEVYGKAQSLLNTQRVEELGLWGVSLKVEAVELQQLRDRNKIVIRLSDSKEEYRLPLNRTNACILAETFGEDAEAWIGKEIVLQKVKRSFQGRLVDAIEVKPVTVDLKKKK